MRRNFVIKKVKNTVLWTYITEEVIIEKVIKKKGDKLYVKLKGYDNLFNSWIDKKRYICIK